MLHLILIVDDAPDIRECFALALSTRDYAVKLCPDRENGVYMLRRDTSIDCILLGYNMPGMSAEMFVGEANKIKPHIGIVLVTASDKVGEKAARLGLTHYLQKPVDFEALCRQVEAACPC